MRNNIEKLLGDFIWLVQLSQKIGVNRKTGDMGLAKKMIDAAVESGADVVKFQTYIADGHDDRSNTFG